MAEHDPTTPEVWKAIPEYIGYEASSLGRIRSFWKQATRPGGGKMSFLGSEPKILKPRLGDGGRPRVNLRHESGRIKTVMVYHAVLWAFVGPCPEGMVACHDPDPNPANNRASNLRWDTQKENMWDAGRHGTKKVLLSDQLAEVARMIGEGHPACEIADRLDVRRPCISRVVRREGFDSPQKWKPSSRFTEELVAEMARLRAEGLTDRQIGGIVGASKASVWRCLRPRSAAQSATDDA